MSTDTGWVLVDAGLKTSYPKIKKLAAQLSGSDNIPFPEQRRKMPGYIRDYLPKCDNCSFKVRSK